MAELPDTSKSWGAAAVMLLSLIWHLVTGRSETGKGREAKIAELEKKLKAAVYAGDLNAVALYRRKLQKYQRA